ncbi:threonine--tRNA ligase [Halostella sp. JP-L12]|uniref:threonyl-tRNA synthetase editing domain-containing protein n=1 Tax=Halostella TaxID=1843185 RepID=UPI000EF826D9|nr:MULTISPECIES: threonyl-tRNA synthetase editing domain-containing protein [Halostella]NHN47040.1 threonine--tRNA ligase [Halostella sp. JP-L12]
MRLLFVHADRAAFEATTTADEASAERDVPLSGELDDCVAAFVAVEAEDGGAPDAAADGAVDEVRAAADRLNADRVALYPSPVLSDDAADAETTASVLERVEAALADREVLRAPAGWHLAFDVSCKGHPLSAFARRVHPARESGSRPPSDWTLLTVDGERRDPEAANPDLDEGLRAVVEREAASDEEVDRGDAGGDGRRWRAAADRLADWGLASSDGPTDDPRWTPRGTVVRDCLRALVDDLAADVGAAPVETPHLVDPGVRDVRVREGVGGGDRYRAEAGDRRRRLRATACAVHCSLLREAIADADDLPVSLYERDGQTFRRATGGGPDEATLPEIRTAVADGPAALEAFERHAMLVRDGTAALGLDCEYVLRATRAFRDANAAWIETIPEALGAPLLLEVLPDPRGDWVAKLDAVATAGDGPTVTLGTVALDDETAERFGVTYADGDGERSPALVHCSPVGSLTESIGALLAAADDRDPPRLPTWIAPTQVRLIPVGEDHVDRCSAVAERLRDAGVRADVDDRAATVGERIARADADRAPYRAVVGDRELARESLPVAERATGRESAMTVGELEAAVREAVDGFPAPRPRTPTLFGDGPKIPGS